MVAVADRRITVRSAATLIAQADEGGQPAREQPRPRLHGHQRPRSRMGVKPAQRGPGALVGDRAEHQTAGHRRRDGAIAVDVARRVVTAEQRVIRQNEVHRDRRGRCRVAAGDSFDQGVGHHLAA